MVLEGDNMKRKIVERLFNKREVYTGEEVIKILEDNRCLNDR